MHFDSYHPMIELTWFVIVIACAILFDHPVFMGIAYLAAFVYSLRLGGRRALIRNLLLLPLMAGWMLVYAYFNHFGVTQLSLTVVGNSITLESLIYGGTIALRAATVVMYLSCLHKVFCTDKVVYIFGRISPYLSLGLAMLLRLVPRTRAEWRKISLARRGVGLGLRDGNIIERTRNLLAMISVIVTWLIDSLLALSDSMRARGVTLRGRRAFSIYRFDHRDRSLVITIALFGTVILCGFLLSQTRIHYDPRIIMNRVTPLSCVFYIAYLAECFLPTILELSLLKYDRISA